uniref:(California timema) hypothetical protein n=1 Tax=Timema californicum TaxID=61474 RepID=A0A7R9J502_TIMCA|nr:unnamed protein product [Timema californicum]
MEIQHGKGPWAPPVSGIVPLGSTLTLVVAINDYRGEFDMRVKSCAASDGGGHVIQLSDDQGCVLRPKMISRFLKARATDERASVITYAFFHAFKFPDAISVHIKCKVEICRHGCLDHCQPGSGLHDEGGQLHLHYGPLERKDEHPPEQRPEASTPVPGDHSDILIYDELVQDDDSGASDDLPVGINSVDRPQASHQIRPAPPETPADHTNIPGPLQEQPRPGHRDGQERFPHGPRNLENGGAFERSAPSGDEVTTTTTASSSTSDGNRRRRFYHLAFTPDTHAEAVTVFQGRIREEVVYGICLPVPGFSVLFILVAVSAVVSALVAGSLLYRYQLQREAHQMAHARQQQQNGGVVAANSLASWMSLRLLGSRTQVAPTAEVSDQPVQNASTARDG